MPVKMTSDQNRSTFNYAVWIFRMALTLMAISLIMVFSSSVGRMSSRANDPSLMLTVEEEIRPERSSNFAYLQRQIMWTVIGVSIMLFFSRFKYSYFQSWSFWMLMISLALLVLVLFCRPINNARRWIPVGPFNIQPSEFARLSMTLFMAAFITRHSDHLDRFMQCLLKATAWMVLVVGLVFIEPDFGASAVIALIVLSMWFMAGFKKSHLAIMVTLAMIAMSLMMVKDRYRRDRLMAFINPESSLLAAGWQPYLSLVSLGSGGLTGVGLGAGMQKYRFQQEAHTDFIFSIIGEEIGLVGLTLLMLIYGALIAMALRVAYQCPDFFGMLVAFGLAMMIAIPTLINIGVATSSLPTKGLALPFISYGGSSMMINSVAVGILMNIAAANYAQKRQT